MKKTLISVFLSLIMVFSCCANVFAVKTVKISSIVIAEAVEIIDGDSLLVLQKNGLFSFVKMAGIDPEADKSALGFLTSRILGKKVTIVPADVNSNDSRWTYAYVQLNGIDYNKELLRLGLAKLNTSHSYLAGYTDLEKIQQKAMAAKLGIWNQSAIYQTGTKVTNINTATAALLQARFKITAEVAKEIIEYRSYNAFNDIYEIRFVPDFLKSNFENNIFDLSVITNINSASKEELASLIGFSEGIATKIIDYRTKNAAFTNTQQLVSLGFITSSVYEDNKQFITIESLDYLEENELLKVNINTADKRELMTLGLSVQQAERLISNRGYGILRSADYLLVDSEYFSKKMISRIADNVVGVTDINSAGLEEMTTVFGYDYNTRLVLKEAIELRPFSDISDFESQTGLYASYFEEFICFSSDVEPSFNLATVSNDKLLDLLGTDYFRFYLNLKKPHYLLPYNLPYYLEPYMKEFTLYTNVNTASYDELLSLSESMTSEIAYQIIAGRTTSGYAYLEEISEIFSNAGKTSVFNSIKGYLIFR